MSQSIYVPDLTRRINTDDLFSDLRMLQNHLDADADFRKDYPLTYRQFGEALTAALYLAETYEEVVEEAGVS